MSVRELPLELVLDILAIVAEDLQIAIRMASVSKHVNGLVSRRIYRRVVIRTGTQFMQFIGAYHLLEQELPTSTSCSLQLIEGLYIMENFPPEADWKSHQFDNLWRRCPNITQYVGPLWMIKRRVFSPTVDLSARTPQRVFALPTRTRSGTFAGITHLFLPIFDITLLQDKAQFPNLTHLATSSDTGHWPLRNLFAGRPSLQRVVVWSEGPIHWRGTRPMDPRIVSRQLPPSKWRYVDRHRTAGFWLYGIRIDHELRERFARGEVDPWGAREDDQVV